MTLVRMSLAEAFSFAALSRPSAEVVEIVFLAPLFVLNNLP